MRWQFGIALMGLALIPAYWWVDARLSGRAPALRFSAVSLLPEHRGGASVLWIPKALKSLAIAAILLGMAQPQMPVAGTASSVEGIDICLALDLSRSMRAEDFSPNRLEAAKETLREFVRARRNDRIALVVFAGDAFLQCPLTLDHEALDKLIQEADFELAETEGTAVGDALAKAAARLKDSTAQSRIIILLTDGENNRGNIDPLTAARAAAALGIRVYTVGVGGKTGAPIPVDDPVYGRLYLRNPDGTLLLTTIDEESLREIAALTGGKTFNAADKEALDAIYHEIDRLERTKLETRLPPAYQSVSHWFYLAAAAFVLLEGILSRTFLRVLP